MAVPPIAFGTDLGCSTTSSAKPARSAATTCSSRTTTRVTSSRSPSHDNLAQALLLRFLTPLGELTLLGHPDYGSRLYELIGELNSDANRNRARMFMLSALAGEPRVRRCSRSMSASHPDRVGVLIVMTRDASSTPTRP